MDNTTREKCCVINDDGSQCQGEARWWVGRDPVDDHMRVCDDHVEAVKRNGDAVFKLERNIGRTHAKV